MATIPRARSLDDEPAELENGDRMTQKEFHRIYERMPEDFKAELIGGIVYVSSPLKRSHSRNHVKVTTILGLYEARTPGVECADNGTIILGDESEPQPDLHVRVLPECGGQSRTTEDDYVKGPSELCVEIASSSRAVDLHAKRADYARHGVLEYLVFCVREREVRWFDLARDTELRAEADGIVRIHAFPGLWIDAAALIAGDLPKAIATLERGLATPEHAAFVERLANARR